MTPRIGSLFSGYGGLDMAVQSVYGGQVAWYSEIDKHACQVLAAHHPGVPNLGDITAVDWAAVPSIDILTGGYPCQPFSHAGKRAGTNDERHLWPYVRDAIATLRPVVTVLENVDGHRSLGLDVVLGDIADMGLSARWGVVRAADAGAPHGRKRVFIVVEDSARGAGGTRPGWGVSKSEGPAGLAAPDSDGPAADAGGEGPQGAAALPTGRTGAESAASIGVVAKVGATANPDYTRQQDRLQSGLPQHDPAQPHRDLAADPDGERYGSGQRPTAVGGMGSAAEIGRRTASTARQEPGAGSTETAADAEGWRRGAGQGPASASCGREIAGVGDGSGTDWGKYAPAITRWESVLGRPAPCPTIPGRNGRPRLSPVFVEWMMGLPAGHVTGHDLTPAAELKMLGNGVCPQQAELALRMLAVAA